MDEAGVAAVTPITYVVFPAIGIAVIVAFVAVHVVRALGRKEQISLGLVGWAGLFVGALAFLCGWSALGLVDAKETFYVQVCVVLTAGGCLGVIRERSFAALERLGAGADAGGAGGADAGGAGAGFRPGWRYWFAQAARTLRDLALIFVASEFARLALELPSNEKVYQLGPDSVAISLAIIFLTSLVAYFVTQRRGIGPALVILVCLIFGIAERFVILFKQNAILPMELSALQTAAEVSGQYIYSLTTSDFCAMVYAGLALIAVSFVRPAGIRSRRVRAYDVGVNVTCAILAVGMLGTWFTVPNYHEDYGFRVTYWRSAESYYKQGIIPSFLAAVEDMPIVAPDGYDADAAAALTTTYANAADKIPGRTARRAQSEAQFEQVKPSVIAVMNESFADLSRLGGLDAGYEGPKFFKGVSDALMRGQLGVSVYGGGTCNSEFEFLTGNSMAFVGSGKYPYQMYDLSNAANLARQFHELGYQTTAMHPNKAANWNRGVVYDQLGFDAFLNTDNDFDHATGFHAGTSDRSTYERILELLNDSEEPQFVFDVTMQNHGGYELNNIPESRLTSYRPQGNYTQEQIGQLNEYLSCIQASDEDLQWFMGELKQLDRPVVLVFFGDHHPNFSHVFNNAMHPDEDPENIMHQVRVSQTDYLIWANYRVVGTPQRSSVSYVGADALGALTLDLIGAPLDDFQRAQLGMRRQIWSISAVGYLGSSGLWQEPDAMGPYRPFYEDMRTMDYLRFGSKYE